MKEFREIHLTCDYLSNEIKSEKSRCCKWKIVASTRIWPGSSELFWLIIIDGVLYILKWNRKVRVMSSKKQLSFIMWLTYSKHSTQPSSRVRLQRLWFKLKILRSWWWWWMSGWKEKNANDEKRVNVRESENSTFWIVICSHKWNKNWMKEWPETS